MHRPLSRLTYIFLASALAVSPLGAAAALSEPAPAPAARDLPDPLHPCTVLLCLPKPGTAAQAATPPAPPTACTTLLAPDKVASDPEEGGQIARTATPKPKPKPKISDMTVTSKTDTASPMLAQPAPSGTTSCGPGGR